MTLSDLQIQANFPLLASATALLDRRLRQGKYQAVLLSSRDCYMQARLWRQMFPATPYLVIYWMTSRWARINGSESYVAYCRELMKERVLIFDLCGSSESLRILFQRAHIRADFHVLQSDPRKNENRYLDGPGDIEGLNCAPHQMIADVDKDKLPVYRNERKIDWNQYFSDIGGNEFLKQCVKRKDYSEFIDASEDELLAKMRTAETLIAANNALFEPFHQMRKEEDWQ